jgi:hypothetical protein
MKKMIRFLSMLFCLTLPNLLAQSTTGTITGIVKDPSGASVSGAKVSVRNLATNETVTTRTTDAGSYTAPSLPPGSYETSVAAEGFKTGTATARGESAGAETDQGALSICARR